MSALTTNYLGLGGGGRSTAKEEKRAAFDIIPLLLHLFHILAGVGFIGSAASLSILVLCTCLVAAQDGKCTYLLSPRLFEIVARPYVIGLLP